jgi:hypothetical protein
MRGPKGAHSIQRGGRDSNLGRRAKTGHFSGSTEGDGGNGRESRRFAPIQRPLTRSELEAAIANVTRALATARSEVLIALVAERAAMRAELAGLATGPDRRMANLSRALRPR